MDMPKKISWEALDHIETEKSNDWFWIAGIIAIGSSVLAIYFNNLLFALLILIGTFTIFLQANKEARIQNYELNRKGLVIGKILYPYSTLDSYYVVDEDGWDRDRILFKSSKVLMPLIIVPIGENASPEQLSDFLIQYLDEEELEESAIEKVAMILGF